MVINSGNYEYIGIRDRESQMLYISDLIEPHSPPDGYGYGQIHIGLYICAMQDVIKRAQQVKDMEEKYRKQDQGDNAHPNSVTDEVIHSNGANKNREPESPKSHSADQALNAEVKGSSDGSDGGSNGRAKGGPCDNCSRALQEVNQCSSRQLRGTDSIHVSGNV